MSAEPTTVEPGDLEALERFIVDNDDLLELERGIGKFNIFDALQIARSEIRHSNFLAFILDPAESHGQGQIFLKAFLMDLLKAAPPKLRPFSPIELDGTDLRGIEIRREWQHVDLLISSQQPPFVVIIENKVGSQEHSDQLSRYETAARTHFPDVPSLFVYLTANGERPSETAWIPYKYADIHRVFSRVRGTYGKAIGEDIGAFLDHYLSLIGSRFMNNVKIDDLCERIYKNHRRALDLIFERAGRQNSGVLAEAENQLQEDTRWHVFWRMAHIVDFIPTSWLEWLPPLSLDDASFEARSWIIFRFHLLPHQLDFYVEVRRMADLRKRRKIVETLIAEGEKIGFKHSGREITDNYTRVSKRERLLRWREGDEPEPDAVRAAVKAKLDEIFPKLAGLPKVLRPLLKE